MHSSFRSECIYVTRYAIIPLTKWKWKQRRKQRLLILDFRAIRVTSSSTINMHVCTSCSHEKLRNIVREQFIFIDYNCIFKCNRHAWMALITIYVSYLFLSFSLSLYLLLLGKMLQNSLPLLTRIDRQWVNNGWSESMRVISPRWES